MRHFIVFFVSFFLISAARPQQPVDVIAGIEKLCAEGKYKEADKVLKEILPPLFTINRPDTLDDFCVYIGEVATNLRGPARAKQELLAFIQKAKTLYPYKPELIAVYFGAAEFFSGSGDNKLAYGLVEEMDKQFSSLQKQIPDKLPRIKSNLGLYALRMGKLGLASIYYRESIKLLESIDKPDQERIYITYNSMGAAMWYASKLDSSIYFFEKALNVLKKLEPTPINKYYRVAIVSNNISGCYSALGKTKEAIQNYEKVIQNYKEFIASKEDFPQKKAATINQFQSIDNLAKIYLELGDFTKGHDLLFYSYQQKLKNFGDKSPEVYKSLIFLGTVYYNQREYNRSLDCLVKAMEKIRAEGNDATVWEADACAQMAVVYEALKKYKEAAHYYEEADRLYEIVYEGQYNDVCLENMMNGSLFYTKINAPKNALAMASKGLNYILKTQGENTLFTFRQLLNMSDVNFKLNNYEAALSYSKKALAVVDKIIAGSTELLDSVKIEMQKPNAILSKTKAEYKLLQNKNSAAIALLLGELNGALLVIEKRKIVLSGEKDISLMIAGYKELLDFMKQLNYDMYRLTNDQAYLDKMIGLHETGMYTRIRSRMDKQKALRFANVPQSVQETEAKLKADITMSLQGEGEHSKKIQAYFTALEKWNDFQQGLRRQYPSYYNMRYAAKDMPIAEISRLIPAGVTLVRYLFTGENLFALVADQHQQKFVQLASGGLDSLVTALSGNGIDAARTSQLTFRLYQELWQPIEKYITQKRVTIIPDGILYNLSMEMLTVRPVTNYSDMAKECLLSRYAISYHYSLLGLKKDAPTIKMKSNFIAFTPGFSDQLKQQYQLAVKNDSMNIDNAYLKLLPLPFTTDLAKQLQKKVGGEIFISDQSTPNAFRVNAGDHRIIHIGTHAEADNAFPEYSRLIFAKNAGKMSEENSIYLFDIYNCALTADLAVLTACETGKPGYQDGEGMISMAHAFNYAGSESILTSLWKIDEQASSLIMSFFYENLQKGMNKDEALRQAKLSYLQQANGRMISPQYWAGLVIMGDLMPVQFESHDQFKFYMIMAAMLLLLVGIYLYRRISRQKDQPL